MEQLHVFDCNHINIASLMTDDCGCAHDNRDHTLIYIVEGELEITVDGKKVTLWPGDCAFLRRDCRMRLQKHASPDAPYRSVELKFGKQFLRHYYQHTNKEQLPLAEKRPQGSLHLIGNSRPQFKGLFQSLLPCFEAGQRPSDEMLRLKMTQGLQMLLGMDLRLWASLFDFVDPWKIDIMQWMEQNYNQPLSLQEMAAYTGRSLSTFKRDFKQAAGTTPERWLVARRLQAARQLLQQGNCSVTQACRQAGFKNLSHFSKVYKLAYGSAPVHAAGRQP